jgi:hypothetical protein
MEVNHHNYLEMIFTKGLPSLCETNDTQLVKIVTNIKSHVSIDDH